MLIRRAEIAEGRLADVRLAGGRIAALAPRLSREPGEFVLDAAGGALLPGLHDHHLHLYALAAAASSVRCGPPEVRGREELVRALRAAPGRSWIRGVGYHESVAGALCRADLDALVADRPLRLQHRSGALWMLNSAAAAQLGLDAGADAPGVERDASGRATGRLFRLDAWLRECLPAANPPDLTDVSRRLAALGVTGVTDATASNGPAEQSAFAAARARGELLQRVLVMGGPDLPPTAPDGVERGAVKIVLAESDLPAPEVVAERIGAAHAQGRTAAIHCVTRAELWLALAAFATAGPREGDRIEHAAVTPPEAVSRLAELRLTVVTQPHFVRERGDAYAVEVEPADRPWLYRARGLLDAGIPLGAGSDAPFGDPDPWRAMAAAVSRESEAGRVLGEGEALAPGRALALFTSPPDAPGAAPRCVAAGEPADLCLLDAPWRSARGPLSAERVRATWCEGALAWLRGAPVGEDRATRLPLGAL